AALHSDPRRKVRIAVAQVLGSSGSALAIEPLLVLLVDKHDIVRSAAADALVRLGWEPNSDAERARLAGGTHCWGEAAVLGPAAVDALTLALGDVLAEVRVAAASALGHTGQPAAVAPLVTAVADANRAVREASVDALATLANPEATEPLLRLLQRDYH